MCLLGAQGCYYFLRALGGSSILVTNASYKVAKLKWNHITQRNQTTSKNSQRYNQKKTRKKMMTVNFFYAMALIGSVFADRSYQNRLLNNLYLRQQAKEKSKLSIESISTEDEIIQKILQSPELSNSINSERLISYLLTSNQQATRQRRTRTHDRAKRYQRFMSFHLKKF